jgi:hypothetical protein
LVFRLYVGQFGIAGMILFLIERTLLFFCRLSTLWFIGSSFGVSCSRRTSGSAWFLDTTAFEWLPRIFSTRLLSGLLRYYMMPTLLSNLLFFGGWFLYRLSLIPKLLTLNIQFINKMMCVSTDAEARAHSISKKKTNSSGDNDSSIRNNHCLAEGFSDSLMSSANSSLARSQIHRATVHYTPWINAPWKTTHSSTKVLYWEFPWFNIVKTEKKCFPIVFFYPKMFSHSCLTMAEHLYTISLPMNKVYKFSQKLKLSKIDEI